MNERRFLNNQPKINHPIEKTSFFVGWFWYSIRIIKKAIVLLITLTFCMGQCMINAMCILGFLTLLSEDVKKFISGDKDSYSVLWIVSKLLLYASMVCCNVLSRINEVSDRVFSVIFLVCLLFYIVVKILLNKQNKK